MLAFSATPGFGDGGVVVVVVVAGKGRAGRGGRGWMGEKSKGGGRDRADCVWVWVECIRDD